MDILSGRKWTGGFKELRKLSALRGSRRGSSGHFETRSPSVVFVRWSGECVLVEGCFSHLRREIGVFVCLWGFK